MAHHKPAPIKYHHIKQSHAGWFSFDDPHPAFGTDGAIPCVGFYFETVDASGHHRGCVIGHIDNETHFVPPKKDNERYKKIVDDVEHNKWGKLVPAGHKGVPNTLICTGNGDPGLGHAIADGFHRKIGGGEEFKLEKDIEGFAVHVVGGKVQAPTFFKGNGDAHYGFERIETEGSLKWTNTI